MCACVFVCVCHPRPSRGLGSHNGTANVTGQGRWLWRICYGCSDDIWSAQKMQHAAALQSRPNTLVAWPYWRYTTSWVPISSTLQRRWPGSWLGLGTMWEPAMEEKGGQVCWELGVGSWEHGLARKHRGCRDGDLPCLNLLSSPRTSLCSGARCQPR